MNTFRLHSTNFNGTFYSITDSHGHSPMMAEVLTEIEKRNKKQNSQLYKEPVFYFDCGDIVGDAMPPQSVVSVYDKIIPKIKTIINPGNVECTSFKFNFFNIREVLKNFKDKGADIVSLSMFDILKQNAVKNDIFSPYKIITDVVDGKKQKIMVTGFTEVSHKYKQDNSLIHYDIDMAKKSLKEYFLPAYNKEKPDKVILMSHMLRPATDALLDYAKELGINNVTLVIGGHSHAIEDYDHNGTRVLYGPCNGQGAYEIKNTKKGIEFDKIYTKSNKYDYSVIKKSKSVISNLIQDERLPMNEEYQQIFKNPDYLKYFKPICKVTFPLKMRNEYNEQITVPSELGSFAANSYKDYAKTDIGLFLSMDLRGKIPKIGSDFSLYNLSLCLNQDKEICKFNNVSTKQLKEIFETSFKAQDKGITNKNFMEYSDNIKIARYINANEKEPKIAQIYIKENEKFIPLLNDKQQPVYPNRKFSIAVCDYMARAGRNDLAVFKNLGKFEKVGYKKQKEIFLDFYEKLSQQGIENFPASQIEDIIKP